MAVAEEIVEELKTAIQTARKRPLAFGLCLGKSPEETVLVTHRTKDPEALERQAKKQGTTPKLVSGTLEVAGKNMTLTCLDKPPAATARQLRAFLKQASLPLKVILLDASGNLLEDSGEEDDGGRNESEDVPNSDSSATWQQALQRLAPAIKAFLASGAPQAPQLGTQLKAAAGLAESGDHAGALAALPAIVEILRSAAQPPTVTSSASADTRLWPASDTQQALGADLSAKWQQAMQRLAPAIKAFLASGGPLAPQLGAQIKAAAGLAEGGEHARALAALPAIVEMLRGVVPPPPSSSPGTPLTPVGEDSAKAKAETVQRLSSLAPELRKLQTINAETFAAIGPDFARMQALTAEGRTDEAQDLADEIEQMMQAALPPSFVGLQKLRLRWQDGKKAAEAQLGALRQSLLAEYQDAEAQEAAARLDLLLGHFNDGLTEQLDDMLNATPGDARNALKSRALSIAADYAAYVATSPLIGLVEDNPYLPVNVRLALLQPLQLLEIELAKAGA
jgi:hypothetical protein